LDAGNIDTVVEILFVNALENQITLNMELVVILGLRVGFQLPYWKNEQRYFKNFYSIFRPNISRKSLKHFSFSQFQEVSEHDSKNRSGGNITPPQLQDNG